MKSKKKVILLIDAIIILAMIVMMSISTSMPSIISVLKQSKLFAESEDLGFNLIPSPEETKVKAGETVTIKLNVTDINVGENGLNSIVGYLNYEESLFESMKIEGTNDWKIELNQRQGHPLYGKFCIYKMGEGETENQEVVTIILKLKPDLKPQTTEVKFLDLKSSDGTLSISEQNRKVRIIIYEDEIPQENIEEPVKPETPQTGDTVVIIATAVIALTVLANILVLVKNKKVKIISGIAVIVIGIAALGITVLAATTAEVLELINKNESWLDSSKYLVTDENITRIEPNTSIDSFKNQLTKNIEIYNGADKVTQGKIVTGMQVKAADEVAKYTVGVVGDMDSDGDSNQVELTTIIRNVINREKWNLTGLNANCADMKSDGTIDEKDIQASVMYIVYGELEIPEVEPVEAPTVEVISGTYDATNKYYTDEVTVKITQNQVDGIKTVYKVEGTSNEQTYTEIQSGDTIKFSEDGIYKISAYTYGKLGNRSTISTIAVSKEPGIAGYKVIYNLEKIDGTYETEEVGQVGAIGETVDATQKDYPGYTLDTENSVFSGVLGTGEELVLNLYYKRNTYTLTLVAGENIATVNGVGNSGLGNGIGTALASEKTYTAIYKWGQLVDISAVLDEKVGNTITFAKWESADNRVIEAPSTQNAQIIMPKGNTTLTATGNARINDYAYTIEYYYDGTKDESKTETESAEFASVINTYTDKIIDGYKLDKVEGTPLTIESTPENNVIKVYYIKDEFNYTVEYYYDGVIDNTRTETESAEFASSIISSDLAVKVEANKLAGYEIDTGKGTNGIEGTPLTISSTSANNVIKVYYIATTYNLSYVLNNGQVAIPNPTTYKVTTENFTLNNPTCSGYNFIGWTLTKLNNEVQIPGTPSTTLTINKGTTGDREYTANWIANTDTQYKVEHYKEKLDGTYELEDTDILGGQTDTTATAEAKTYEGFTLDLTNANTVQSGTITADGQLVLKLYYTRNQYTLTLVAGENIASVNGAGTYKYEQPIEIEATIQETDGYTTTFTMWESSQPGLMTNQTEKDKQIAMPLGNITLTAKAQKTVNEYTLTLIAGNNITSVSAEEETATTITKQYAYGSQIQISANMAEEDGYTCIFDCWQSADSNIIADQGDRVTLIGMPSADVTLTAKAIKTKNNYEYTVEYYFDGVIDNSKTAEDTAQFASNITYPSTKAPNKIITGYELDKVETTPLTITSTPANNIMKVYYIATTYNLSYVLNGGEVAEPNPTTYKVTTENFTLSNPTKTGYGFTGWTLTKLNDALTTGETANTTVTINKGSTGNREYTAGWLADTDTEYKVNHYTEKLDGTYELANTDNLVGETNTEVTAEAKTYEGFELDLTNENTVQSGTIQPDGSLTLSLYYTRKSYTLTLVAGENIASVSGAGNYKHGQNVDISAAISELTGYTTTFARWTSSDTSKLANNSTKDTQITMPIGDITLTASAVANKNNYAYTIEYYYDGILNSEKTSSLSAQYESEITLANIQTRINNNTTAGYEFEKTENLPLTITTESANNVIKVYYIATTYNLSYVLNEGEVAEPNPTTYKVTTENFILSNPTKIGYSFTGWTLTKLNDVPTTGETANITVTINKGSTGNREYTANWQADTDTEYKVNHYTEKLDGTYELADTDNLVGETNTEVTAEAKTYEGFTEDTEIKERTLSGEPATIAPERKAQGTIQPDGSLTLSLYYTRKSYTLTLVAGENIASVNGAGNYKHGQNVDISAAISELTGYTTTFARWTSSDTSKLANNSTKDTQIIMPIGDITLTASAVANKNNYGYTIEYYYDNELDSTKTVTDTQKYEYEIITYEDKVQPGYEFDKVETIPLTITTEPENNVIKVYYKLINYSVTYNLDGGELGEGITNATTYNIKTADFTLNNPTKFDYTFTGWTGSNGDVPQKNITVDTSDLENKEYTANWTKTVYETTIHHYEEGTTTSVAPDEIIVAPSGVTYQITTLLDESNGLKVAEETISTPRGYLNPNKYVYVSAVRDEENTTIDELGTINGTVQPAIQEITYYYHVNRYQITGEVIGENGVMEAKIGEQGTIISDVSETVDYGENSTKEIILTPIYGYRVSKIMIYTGEEIDGTYGTTEDGGTEFTEYTETIKTSIATIPVIENVIENMHIVATFEEKPIVAQIVAVPVGSETLANGNGKTILNNTYYSLEDAINDAMLANENPGVVQIKLLADIRDESNIIEDGNNVVIDLNGYTITSNSTNPVLTIQEAELVVEDNSVLESGKIVSTKGVGIWVTPIGELTLGDKSTGVSQKSPSVQGETYGIYKEKDTEINIEGIFNFYDGEIIGGLSALGGSTTIDATPTIYDPYDQTVTLEDGTAQRKTLQVISGVEALIGKSRYPTIEEAFLDAESIAEYTADTPVEIDLVTDAVVEEAIEVMSTNPLIGKNIILDLNGHAITSNATDYIIENSEKLQIIDSGLPLDGDAEYKTLVANGTTNAETSEKYGFELVGDHLESNNKGVVNSTASSYIEIDLTDIPDTQTLTLAVRGMVSSQQSYDFMYATVTTTETMPSYSTSTGRFVYAAGQSALATNTTTLAGGTKYYLHLGYYKNDSTDMYLDCAKIYGITLDGVPLLEELPEKTGKISNTNAGTILNTASGDLTISGGNIEMLKNTNGLAAILNENNLTVDGGFITVGTGNSVYGIYNKSTGTANVSGGIINAINSNTVGIYNAVGGTTNISGNSIVNATYIGVNNFGTANISGGTVSSYNGISIIYQTGSSGNITGGTTKTYSGTCIQINQNVNIEISNVNIEGGRNQGIGIGTVGTTTIRDVNIKNVSPGVYVTGGTTNIESATINATSNGVKVTAGILNIQSADIYSENTACYSSSSGTLNIYDGVIAQGRYTGVKNENILNMYGGTVIGENSDGINNYSNGNNAISNIYAGTVESKSTSTYAYAINCNNYQYSTKTCGVVIGKKNTSEETEVSTTTPIIKSNNNKGIYNPTGFINFYDGQIIGTKAISAGIEQIEEADSNGNKFDVQTTTIEEDGKTLECATLGIKATPVAKIAKTSADIGSLILNTDYTEDTDYYYFNLLDTAVSACSTEAGETQTTIQIIENIETSQNIEILSGQNIILDLNGKTINSYNNIGLIINNGAFKLIDSSEDLENAVIGTGTIDTRAVALVNNGNMNLQSGTIINNVGGIVRTKGIIIKNTSDLQITGANIIGNAEYTISIYNTGKIDFNSGAIKTFRNTSYGIYNVETGTVAMSGGTITGAGTESTAGYAIYNSSSSIYEEGVSEPSINITGGTLISSNANAIQQEGTGDLYISGENTEIRNTTTYTININSVCKVKIDDGTITNSSSTNNNLSAILMSYGELEVNGGNITGCNCGITIQSNTVSKKITINGGNITGTSNIGINNLRNAPTTVDETKMTIIDVTGKNETYIKGAAYGIYTKEGVTNIGTQGGVPSVINPKVEATNSSGIGIYNVGGVFNFYDGIIIGASTKSISGTISSQEAGYDIIKTINATSKEEATLQLLPVVKVVVTSVNTDNLTGINSKLDDEQKNYLFYSIADAATACVDSTKSEIALIRNITYIETHETETIPSTKNVSLNLSGYSISSSDVKTFINNGTLEIVDTNATAGTIRQTTGTIIENAGTLNINQNLQYTMTNSGTSESNGNLFVNSGEMNISDGIFATATYNNTINNLGELNISNATFSSSAYNQNCIINTGSAKITNGTFKDNITNNGEGTILISDGTFTKSIYNNGTNVYEEDVSEPGLRITGGKLQSSGCINITNTSSGQVIIEKTGETELIISDTGTSGDCRAIVNSGAGEIIIDGADVTTRYQPAVSNKKNGKITIKSGIFTSTDGTSISNEGELSILDGQINSGISNNGILSIYGGVITSKSITLQNTAITGYEAQCTIEGGTIATTSTTSSAVVNNGGMLTIGKDDSSLNVNSPIITTNGGKGIVQSIGNGVNSIGILNYYDGTVSGTELAIDGEITGFDRDNEIIINVHDGIETVSLGTTTAVAYVGEDTTNTYNTIQEALEACTGTQDKITLLKNIGIPKEKEITISATQNIILDLNNKTINAYTPNAVITNNGTFELVDSFVDSTAKIIQFGNTCIKNNGTLTISGGWILSRKHQPHKIIDNASISTLNITGGILQCQNLNTTAHTQAHYAIYSNTSANINLTGGTIKLVNKANSSGTHEYIYGIYVDNADTQNKATILISGTSEIIGSGKDNVGISTKSGSNVEMLGGTIKGDANTIGISLVTGNLEMSGGKIEEGAYYGIETFSGTTATIKDNAIINLTAGGYGIKSSGNVNISGGTIIGNDYGIYSDTGEIQITGGTIKGRSGGIRANNSSVLITAGNVIGTTQAGIYLYKSTLTLGEDDNTLTNDQISITGKTYGVELYSDYSTFNFYDGIIHGDTLARSGAVDGQSSLFSILSEEEGKTEYIGILSETEAIVKVGSSYANTFAEAITSIMNTGGTGTMVVQKNVVTATPIVIPESTESVNVNITLDLNGNSIRWAGTTEAGIINNSNLTIINSIEDNSNLVVGATLQNYGGVVVENKGTLKIGNDTDGIVYTNSPRIIGETYAIDNTAENAVMYLYDGILKGVNEAVNGTINNITTITGYVLTTGTEVIGESTYITKTLSNGGQ